MVQRMRHSSPSAGTSDYPAGRDVARAASTRMCGSCCRRYHAGVEKARSGTRGFHERRRIARGYGVSRTSGPWWAGLAARGETPATFDQRCIPPERRCSSVSYGQYAPSSRLVRRAPRRPRCDAGFHHGLLGGVVLAGPPGGRCKGTKEILLSTSVVVRAVSVTRLTPLSPSGWSTFSANVGRPQDLEPGGSLSPQKPSVP